MALPKIIKAGGGERGQFILREFNDNTVRFVLNYPGIVDVDILRKAIKAVVESVDVLHGTFFTEGISAHWKLNENMDLRRHCVHGESEGLCNMSGSFMTLLENGVSQSFAETLAIIAEQTTKVKENPLAGLEGMPIVHALARNVPIGLLLEIMGRVYGTAPVGVTNLGNLKCADFALGGIAPKVGIFGGPLKKKPGMQISIISFDGECVLAVAVQCTDEDVVVLQKTLDDMVAEITAYAEE